MILLFNRAKKIYQKYSLKYTHSQYSPTMVR